MISAKELDAQLKRRGIVVRYWGAAEKRELPAILTEGEEVVHLVNGFYENGFATLVTTDRRLLLVDKKWFSLAVEDIQYDMIAEVDYNASLINSSICLSTVNKEFKFSSFQQKRLRAMTNYVRERVMEMRQRFMGMQLNSGQDGRPPAFAQPIVAVQGAPFVMPSRPNPYIKNHFTSRQKNFLPKFPRRK